MPKSHCFLAHFISVVSLSVLLNCTGPDSHHLELSINEISNPASEGSRYPNLFAAQDGSVFMSWTTVSGDSVYTHASAYSARAWTSYQPFSSGAPADYFVNWADFPSVVGSNETPLAAHWLRKVDGGTFAYHVAVSFFDRTTKSWQESFTAHEDQSPTEHGFVSMVPLRNDAVLAIWLDGRNTGGHHGSQDFAHAMTLRSAELAPNGTRSRKRQIDDVVCDCCQTDLVSTGNDFLAVYRNRAEGEIRDIAFSRYNTELGEWSESRIIHNDGWEIGGCPVNGPRAASYENQLAVIWYTQAGGESKVKLARSGDYGHSFDEAISLEATNPAGRTDVLFTSEGHLFVSWLDIKNGEGHIMLQQIFEDGSASEPIKAAVTDPTPRSGFPRMVPYQNGIMLSWTETSPSMQVRTALVGLN